MWGMGDHARPIHTFEETVHIPMIISQPGRIPEDTVFEGRTCNYDFFPSLMDFVGIPIDVPMSPGRSFAPCLEGEALPDWDGCVFHEFENTRMVRTDRWKYTWRNPEGPNELYDFENDPGERENRAGGEEWAEVEREMQSRIRDFFETYADPQYDLWKSGRSKAGRLV